MASIVECDQCHVQAPEGEAADWISVTIRGTTYDFSSVACMVVYAETLGTVGPVESREPKVEHNGC